MSAQLPTLIEYWKTRVREGEDITGVKKLLCPFHKDTNPSMHHKEEAGIVKCFSCGAGGDLIAVHKANYGLKNRADAKKHLYEMYGVTNSVTEYTKEQKEFDALNLKLYKLVQKYELRGKAKELIILDDLITQIPAIGIEQVLIEIERKIK